jgi:hypothetical protein
LAVYVARLDDVEVDEPKTPDAGTRQRLDRVTPDGAESRDQNARIAQTRQCVATDHKFRARKLFGWRRV